MIDSSRTFRSLLKDGPVQREDGHNRYFYFRKEYDFSELPLRAVAQLFADGRYKLFVNGKFLGRGPTRASAVFPRYDEYDIKPFLQKGRNAVAILALSYGVDTAWYERAANYWQCVFGDGGVHFSAKLTFAESVDTFCSDDTWRCASALAWHCDTPRIGWGLGYIEDYDANLEPEGWTKPGFDDAGWEHAQNLLLDGGEDDRAKGFAPIRPFPILTKSQLPMMRRDPVAPLKVLSMHHVVPDTSLPLGRRLYEEVYELYDEPMGPDVEFPLRLSTSSGRDLSLLFKFEKIHSGYPFIELEAKGGEVIEIAVAETLPGEFETEKRTANRLVRESYLDGAHLIRYKAKPGYQKFERFELTAVRYLQLVIRNAAEGVTVRSIGSTSSHYPAEVAGSFSCSDETLDRLWLMGVYTIQQCSHDAWEDCPSREQRQWLGDGVVRYPASAVSFGPAMQVLDQNFILQCAESQRADGLLQMFAPGDHKINSIIIPDYSLHWILVLRDYMENTNDLETLRRVFPTVEKVLAWFANNVADSGLLEDIPYWHFIEWADIGRTGASCAINALYVGTLKSAIETANMLGYELAARGYQYQADLVASSLNSSHWNSQRNLYVDEVNDETQGVQVSQQANAFMIHFDIAPRHRREAMIDSMTDPQRVKLTAVAPITKGDPDFDPAVDIVKSNSFLAHFLYSALAKSNRMDLALTEIRRAFAPMLVADNHTLWESFEPTTSLCHAFSASPVYHLSRYLLGIHVAEQGSNQFKVQVQLCDLEWVNGVYPTSFGGIQVKWKRCRNRLSVTVVAPPGIIGHVEAPLGWTHISGNVAIGGDKASSSTIEFGQLT